VCTGEERTQSTLLHELKRSRHTINKEIYRNGNSIDAWVQVEWSRGERKKEGKIQEVDRHMGK